MTKGEKIMRTKFNPSNESLIDEIKNKYAELYNLIDNKVLDDVDSHGNPDITSEFYTSKEKALNDLKQSCMWAINAVTTNF